MYQRELFSNLATKHGKFLGDGLFANVWEMTDGNVCKVSRSSDGTRNWLELCALHTAASTLLPMMPEVFSVVPCEEGYMAIMPKYGDSYEHYQSANYGCPQEEVRAAPGYKAARQAFSDYLYMLIGERLDYWRVFDDVHSGNVMWCARRGWIITDPSSMEYMESVRTEFLLN